MDLLPIERNVVLLFSIVAVASCLVVLVNALRRKNFPAFLRRIELTWTAVSLGILLGLLAATSFLPLDG